MGRHEVDEPSRAAGGCVLLLLAGVALAVVFAVSTAAGILTVWASGITAVWWSMTRRKGTDQPLPSPTEPPSRGDVFAVETGRAAEVRRTPSGGYVIHPEVEYVLDDGEET